ncbi:MAG: hypothetical protein CL916_08080 [Deltaproteobacteria bacterium]|nr:hypothetical protein [Deltaproteobacteria bacterium]
MFCFIFFIMYLSCSKPSSNIQELKSSKPKHYIFLIHGIGGDRSHFGKMKDALIKVLSEENKQEKYSIHHIEYDTKNNQKDIEDFSQVMNNRIQNTVGSNLPDSDRISIIMHSQGGLVGSIWLFRSMQKLDNYAYDLIDNIDCFITLGTPFWGAKTAIFAKKLKDDFSKSGLELPIPFGTKQLEYMEFGSDWNYHMRTSIIKSNSIEHVTEQRKKIRFLNIAAKADVLTPLGLFVGGGSKYEDDSAVPLPSSRFNFIYNHNNIMKEINWAPYILVDALHLSPLPDSPNFYGLVQIPQTCIENSYCKHPTFQIIWNTILNRVQSNQYNEPKNIHSFMVDINLVLPAEINRKDIKIDLYNEKGLNLENSQIYFSKTELYSQGTNLSKKYQNMIRFYFNGSFKDSSLLDSENILVRISGDNLLTKDIPLQVKRGYSSFLDTIMESKQE